MRSKTSTMPSPLGMLDSFNDSDSGSLLNTPIITPLYIPLLISIFHPLHFSSINKGSKPTIAHNGAGHHPLRRGTPHHEALRTQHPRASASGAPAALPTTPYSAASGARPLPAGTGGCTTPHLFVVHAIWGPRDWVVRLLYEFSAHWGVLFNMDKLTYPKIDYPKRGYLLFLGKTPVKAGSQVSMPRYPHAMGEAPRHDRVPFPLRPSGVVDVPTNRQPLKPAQNPNVQVSKPQGDENGIK